MDKLNSRSVVLFAIALSIGFHSAALSPLSARNSLDTATNATHHRAKSILLLFEAHNRTIASNASHSPSDRTATIPAIVANPAGAILSASADSNGTSKVNSSEPTDLAQPRAFQILEFNSWIVGLVMGALQSVFGKWLVPDSKIFLLQTLVNPMYPLTYGRKLFDDLKEAEMNSESRLLAQTAEKASDYSLDLILDSLKPKIVDGLSELADSGLLDQVRPLVSLSVENLNGMDYGVAPLNSTLLSHEIKYDVVDLVDYESHTMQRLNRTRVKSNGEVFDEFIDRVLSKKQVNSSQKLDAADVVANGGSSIDKEGDAVEPSREPAITTVQSNDASNRTAVEFREGEQEISYSVDPPTSAAEQSNRTKAASSMNSSTDLAPNDDGLVDLDKPILSLVICDDEGKNCKEEEIDDEFLNGKPTNETQYSEPSKQQVAIKRPGFVRTVIRKVISRLTALSERPVAFLKETFISVREVAVRESRLIWRMLRVLYGSRSPTCRHKFLCLFSSYFALHTPEFVKTNMPTSIENYYIQIMEAANRYESLNALVSGYAGLDCNEIYSDDQRCPK